jgi:hypothetical protein
VYTVALAFIAYQAVSTTSTYDSAPVCASTTDISSCRFQGPARIVRLSTDKQGDPSVDVTFVQLGARVDSAHLDKAFTSEWQTLQVEGQVNAELWNSRLTAVAGVKTLSNPDTFPASALVTWTWISAAVTLLLVAVGLWWLRLSRRIARERQSERAAEAVAHPTATQQMPLTPDMTGFLKSDTAVVRNPLRVVLPILGAAAIIPAVFSAVFIAQNQLLNIATGILWVVFLGLGGLVALGIIAVKGQEKRDLAGGVFVRATGPFYVQVNYTKAGTFMVVTIGGRALTGVYAKPLESIESDIGTVDYLPVSGDLLEVNDESGQLLWSRFAAAHIAQPG